ncbi:MAG: deoxyribodipyrimidine photo-lyase [Pseudomonadota bacterium]
MESGRPVVPLFVLDEETEGMRPLGGASRWWLHHSLASLASDIAGRGASLVLKRGQAARILPELVEATGASAVYWNRAYERPAIDRDTTIKQTLKNRGIEARSFNASLLMEPWTIETKAGQPFRVFTPFWKTLSGLVSVAPPTAAPKTIPAAEQPYASDPLEDWRLLPTEPDWATGFSEPWEPGEAGAHRQAERFQHEAVVGYKTARDIPGVPGTSRLSPHLHFGEIGPRQLWHAVSFWADEQPSTVSEGATAFLRELGWREFNYHLLYHFPNLVRSNIDTAFDAFEWRDDDAALTAWQRGRTGYPIVDAGMRELWQTGWMHNRVRMAAASFLVKHLLIDWRVGEEWFWDTLVDADPANNAGNWQWVAGCGFDAAPYFRIFNPILQGERFDKDGAYVRRWVPEIAGLPDRFLHKPWEAPADTLVEANLTLGETYPLPIVDHRAARQRALDAFARIKKPPQ